MPGSRAFDEIEASSRQGNGILVCGLSWDGDNCGVVLATGDTADTIHKLSRTWHPEDIRERRVGDLGANHHRVFTGLIEKELVEGIEHTITSLVGSLVGSIFAVLRRNQGRRPTIHPVKAHLGTRHEIDGVRDGHLNRNRIRRNSK